MELKQYTILIKILFLLAFISCSKSQTNNDGPNNSREQPTHPEGITLDTTWHNDTIIHF